jgi:hypothetical protein
MSFVVGGGPAGLGAAVGAACADADVILAERCGFLGGNATAALVMPLMSFHNESRAARDRPGGLGCSRTITGRPRSLTDSFQPGHNCGHGHGTS